MRGLKIQAGEGSRLYPSGSSQTSGDPPIPVTSGLVQWFEARRVEGVASGDALPTWNDLSGKGNNATRQNAGAFPKYMVGNAPYIEFDGMGTGNYYNTGDFSALTEGECFIVAQGTADPPVTQNETGLWTYGTSGDADLFPWSNEVVYCGWGSDTRKMTDDPVASLTNWNYWNVWSAANDFAMKFNGAAFYSTATNTVAFSSACTLARASETGRRWAGNIAMYAMYDRKLDASERTAMEAYTQEIVTTLG